MKQLARDLVGYTSDVIESVEGRDEWVYGIPFIKRVDVAQTIRELGATTHLLHHTRTRRIRPIAMMLPPGEMVSIVEHHKSTKKSVGSLTLVRAKIHLPGPSVEAFKCKTDAPVNDLFDRTSLQHLMEFMVESGMQQLPQQQALEIAGGMIGEL